MTQITAVPLLDLKPQFTSLATEIRAAIERVLVSQQFINGPEVTGLEEEIAAYCGVPHAIGVSSGTDALLIALMAMEIGQKDEVITTPYTFFATAGAIARVGATPVFVDIKPDSFNLNPELIEAKITPKTKAIMPVHLYGQCADMDAINSIAKRHDLPVIEDGAQAIGAEYKGKRAGAMGDVGCFSFFPSKNLGACGDGGMVVCSSDSLAHKIRALRNHGESKRYHHDRVGGNFRLDAMQAAVVRVKLPHLDGWSNQRTLNSEHYENIFQKYELTSSNNNTSITLPKTLPNRRHVYNQYIIRAKNRDALLEYLRTKDIGCNIYYPVSLHQQPCFSHLGYSVGDFPEAERAAAQTLALPIYPELTVAQLERVVEVIQAFY